MGGHLHIIQWARSNGCPWDTDTCYCAAKEDHLLVLQWAHENGCPWDEDTWCWGAANNGRFHILQWARENGCPWNERTCWGAASSGHPRHSAMGTGAWLMKKHVGAPLKLATYKSFSGRERMAVLGIGKRVSTMPNGVVIIMSCSGHGGMDARNSNVVFEPWTFLDRNRVLQSLPGRCVLITFVSKV